MQFSIFSKHKQVRPILAMAACTVLALSWLEPTKVHAIQSQLAVSIANAGVQSYATSGLQTTATLQVEDFTGRSSVNFTNVGGMAFSGSGTIGNANVYGGAGGSGQFATASNMLLTMPSTSDYRYVGFWWSAGNTNNHVDILDVNDNVLATFTVDIDTDPDPAVDSSSEDLLGVVGNCAGASSSNNYNDNGYCGNPNTTINGVPYSTRATPTEQYAFVHLRYNPGFRKVRFRGSGFELDNVTISQTLPPVAETETQTETYVEYDLVTPGVLVADPRSSLLSFPGVNLNAGAGETNAMICFSQVDQAGSDITGSAEIAASGSSAGITVTTATNLLAFSGSRDTVVSFTPSIDFQSLPNGERFGVGSLYIRVSATPQTNVGVSGCTGDAADSEVIEIRFLNPTRSNSLGISLD